MSFGRFTSLRKKGFFLDQERWLEVDVYCQAEDSANADLAIEVMDRRTAIPLAHLEKFVRAKEQLEPALSRPTAFLFHAEQGLSAEQESFLASHGVMCSDRDSLGEA